jgi:hypothetical protein
MFKDDSRRQPRAVYINSSEWHACPASYIMRCIRIELHASQVQLICADASLLVCMLVANPQQSWCLAGPHLSQQLRSSHAHLWDVQHDWTQPEALPLLLSLLRGSSPACSCGQAAGDTTCMRRSAKELCMSGSTKELCQQASTDLLLDKHQTRCCCRSLVW